MGERDVVKGPVNWKHGEQRDRSKRERLGGGIIDIASPSLDDYFVANLHYPIICPRGGHRRSVPPPNSASVVAYRAPSNE